MLVSIGLFWCIIPTLTNAPLEGMNIISFVCLYIIAGYIRLWGNDSGSGKYIALSVIFLAVSYIFNMLIALAASKYNYFEGKSMYFYGMHRPFVVLSSLCLFIGFKNMKMNYSWAINIIASATFGVYLIHNDNFFRNILWRDIFRNASFQYSPYLIPYSIAVILIVYISCTVIELIRSRIFKTLSHGRLS